MNKYLITGAGGFIGGHIVNRLVIEGNDVTAVDIKPLDLWFQKNDFAKNISLDLRNNNNCEKVVKDKDFIINMACNMGGIGFIENNKADCMLSVLINTHLLSACKKFGVKKYFFSSTACVYSERMCRHFYEDYGVDAKVARYHNIYGIYGTYDGGREKSPAALCRKIALAKINNSKKIEVWGNGLQTRSYLYIDDCIDATLKFFNSKSRGPINIGSEEQVSINQMIDLIEEIANYKVDRNYNLKMPIGVTGRSSNNEKINNELGWEPNYNLKTGLEKTYKWIYDMISKNKNSNSIFTIS